MKLTRIDWIAALFLGIIVFILMMVAGCKIKNKEREVVKQKVELTQIKTSTITTVIDTTVKIPEKAIEISEPLSSLQNGDTLRGNNNGLEVEAFIDKGNLVLKARQKEQTIDVKATKTETSTESTKLKTDTKEVKSKVETKSDVGANLKWLFWLFLVLAIIIFLVYQYFNHNFPFNLFSVLLLMLW